MAEALRYFIGFLVLAGLFLLWLGNRKRKKAGIPSGRIVYADTGKVPPKPFYDPELGLTGRPDYLVEHGDLLIPVEVKSAKAPPEPYDSHILQVAAYCLLVERQTDKRAPYGWLRYQDRVDRIDFTPELEQRLLDLLTEMRRAERRGLPDRSHHSPARCRACGYRALCDQRLDRPPKKQRKL